MSATVTYRGVLSQLTTGRLKLKGGQTTLYIVRHSRAKVRPRVIVFQKPTLLIDWCVQNNVSSAINGGFFCRDSQLPMGEIWSSGSRLNYKAFDDPWSQLRGCLHIYGSSSLVIAPRLELPSEFDSDMVQAGPILMRDGRICIGPSQDTEGFSSGSHQFDSDISQGRYPRAAIGFNESYLWSVVCDGYSQQNSGLSFAELADVFVKLGATHALNLDGGGSSTLISGGSLVNKPRTRDLAYPKGRAIYSAIVFEPADV